MASLQLDIVLTTSDGLKKEQHHNYDFGMDDEGAIDMYWALLNSGTAGSQAEEGKQRGKKLGQSKNK